MDDELFRALQEQAHHLTELEKHPGWAVLLDYLHTAMNPDKRAVLNGTIGDIDRYHRVTGKLQGVHMVIDAPESVRNMVLGEVERREEKQRAFRESR